MRSRWKNAYVKNSNRKRVVNSRSTTILPVMNASVFLVHNGRTSRPIKIKPSMFGTKLGEYVRTKEICVFRRRKNKKKKNKQQKKSKKAKSK